jgi:glutamate N-acetyltransferase/amino-acid N-acetyltransferase
MQIIPNGSITSPRGFLAGAVYAGIKTYGAEKKDLTLLVSTAPCAAAGVFTTNKVKAAPVLLCQEHLSGAHAQGIIANAGCANACTGAQGAADAAEMAALAAAKLHLEARSILVASTGKIGMPMPMDKVRQGLQNLVVTPDGGFHFAQAIMTTDTRRKEIAVSVPLPHVTDGANAAPAYIIAGCCKGAGMIHPNMATMLAFVTTDAAVDPAFLHSALHQAADVSFNMVSIDGDTSTNDTLVILANGQSHQPVILAGTPEARHFQAALDYVCVDLARRIAADGEAATRLIKVVVRGAASLADARLAARSVAGSTLTKCAVHGADPNWGRILCAVGYSGAQVNPDRLECHLGDVCVVRDGTPVAFDEAAAHQALAGGEVAIAVDLHLGGECATAWGCDLTEGYVRFNSEYTT